MGREASYQFTAQECLADIAEQAQAKRLLVVRCNRPHIFPDMKGMQAELSPVCRSLAPLPSGGVEEPIPFMGVESESEWVEVAAGNGPMTGTAGPLLYIMAQYLIYSCVFRRVCG